MISGFETGHWYRCIKKERQRGWNDSGKMDIVLDGKPRMCIDGIGIGANFADCSRGNGRWTWGLDEFEEVDMPKKDRVLDRLKRNLKQLPGFEFTGEQKSFLTGTVFIFKDVNSQKKYRVTADRYFGDLEIKENLVDGTFC